MYVLKLINREGFERMKIVDIIKGKRAGVSFEFFPPKDKAGEDRLFGNIGRLEALHPDFVSVTYGAGGGTLKNTRNVVLRIKKETSLVPMPHLTCIDQSEDTLKAILEDYRKNCIENILALRGDPPEGSEKFTPHPQGYCYARDLVKLAASMSAFSIGVACYPEGHCESPNLEMDMVYTKEKIEAGADFAMTQMFFDNVHFYNFRERAVRAGILVPIIPGIMPITDFNRIKEFAAKCCASIPDRIIKRFEKITSNPEEMKKVGIELATEQCADLLAHGVNNLHFYTLNQSAVVLQIVNNLGLPDLGRKALQGSIDQQ
jgi:methylenetetrahydrofolate reductase (NADPH)